MVNRTVSLKSPPAKELLEIETSKKMFNEKKLAFITSRFLFALYPKLSHYFSFCFGENIAAERVKNTTHIERIKVSCSKSVFTVSFSQANKIICLFIFEFSFSLLAHYRVRFHSIPLDFARG